MSEGRSLEDFMSIIPKNIDFGCPCCGYPKCGHNGCHDLESFKAYVDQMANIKVILDQWMKSKKRLESSLKDPSASEKCVRCERSFHPSQLNYHEQLCPLTGMLHFMPLCEYCDSRTKVKGF